MTSTPEIPKRKPKMAQGRKAGELPPDDSEYLLRKLVRDNEKLKSKKIQEILDRQNKED